MTFKRLWIQFRLLSFGGNGHKRAAYAKKKGLYAAIGEGSQIPTALPLYPQLIKIGNNVNMHRSVQLVTHDYINRFLMKTRGGIQYKHLECLTPIEIMDDVYICENSIILGNVHIGSNVIISAGSVVTNDIPSNSIVAGVPAKVVGDFERYKKARVLMDKTIPYEFTRSGKEEIDQETVAMAWEAFDKKRSNVRGS